MTGGPLAARRDARSREALARGLIHAQAHVLAPAVETLPDGGHRRHDVLIVPGERHAVVLALAPTRRRRDLAAAVSRLGLPMRPGAIGHPEAPHGLLADDAHVLRTVVVLRTRGTGVRWLPDASGHVPVVPLRVLAAALRDRDHPDEIWRELADGAGGDQAWPPVLDEQVRAAARQQALAPRAAGSSNATTSRTLLRPAERRRADRLLTRVQAPPLRDWTRHEAQDGRLRLWQADPPTVLTMTTARGRPDIAVVATTEDPTMLPPAAAVADGLAHSLDLLRNDRGARAALRRVIPRGRAVLVELALEPLDHDVVAYIPDGHPRRGRRILLGVSSTREHADGQALLLTVARAVADLLASTGSGRAARRRRAADRLLLQWSRLPQTLHTTRGNSPVWSSDRFGAWGPPGPAEEATVDLMLCTAAARRALPPGTLTGEHARGFLRGLADDLLVEAAALTGTCDAALLVCADQLHRAVAARFHDDQEAAASMTGPWWHAHLPGVAPLAAAAPAHTGAAELLVENALRRHIDRDVGAGPPERAPDRPAWRTAAAAAARARSLSTLATADLRRLTAASVTVSLDGTVVVGDHPGPTDYAPYTRLRALTAVTDLIGEQRAAPLAHDDGRAPPGRDRPFQRLRDIPDADAIRPIDDAVRATIGASLEALIGTLVAAADHLPTTGTASRDDVVADAAAYTGLPTEEITAAVDWLTLPVDRLREEPFEYWKTEARTVRLAAQPFLPVRGAHLNRLLLIPGRIRLSQLAYLTYLDDGRLPLSRAVLRHPRMKQLDDELNRYRQRRNNRQEIEAYRIVQEAGWPCRRDLDPRKQAKHDLSLTGQIDLLVAVPTTRRVWVAEVKDPAVAFSPWEAADEIDDFHGGTVDTGTGRSGRRDEIGRLLAKTDDIARQLPTVLRLLGIDGSPEAWQAQPIVLTRRLTPAAFVSDPRVPFALVRQAAVALRQEELAPGPRLWLPGPRPT